MVTVGSSTGFSANNPLGWLGMVAMLAFWGCGSNRGPLGQVQGTVHYRGSPIAEGQIVFEVAGARPAQGRILDGRIVEVTSYAPGDGAPLGLARIAVFATPRSGSYYASSGPVAPDESLATERRRDPGERPLIPTKYNDLETSGLSHELVAGHNEVTLVLHD